MLAVATEATATAARLGDTGRRSRDTDDWVWSVALTDFAPPCRPRNLTRRVPRRRRSNARLHRHGTLANVNARHSHRPVVGTMPQAPVDRLTATKRLILDTVTTLDADDGPPENFE